MLESDPLEPPADPLAVTPSDVAVGRRTEVSGNAPTMPAKATYSTDRHGKSKCLVVGLASYVTRDRTAHPGGANLSEVDACIAGAGIGVYDGSTLPDDGS